jgi:hypothetical protein
MSSPEDKARGFVVSDRRSFTTGGEPRPPESSAAEPAPEPPAAPSSAPAEAAAGEAPVAQGKAPEPEPKPPEAKAAEAKSAARLPPVDFHTFVISLGSSALIHLGDLEQPSGKVEKNLPMAKHTIDILSMLQEKTKGNLTQGEAQLLESLLYDLRLRFVSAAK